MLHWNLDIVLTDTANRIKRGLDQLHKHVDLTLIKTLYCDDSGNGQMLDLLKNAENVGLILLKKEF